MSLWLNVFAVMDYLQKLFKSVSGETRLKILLLLLQRKELSVGEITATLEGKVSTISRNLTILERDNFVKAKHISSNVYYSINNNPRYRYNRAILQVLRLRLEESKIRKKLENL